MGQETRGNGEDGIGGVARVMVEGAGQGTGAGRRVDGEARNQSWGIFFSF
jgi:hypothetical protein